MSKIKAVLFDFDGTVAATEEVKQALLNQQRQALNLSQYEVVPGTVGGDLPGYEVAQALGMEYDEYIFVVYKSVLEQTSLKPGVMEAVYGCRSLGIKTAIASLGYRGRVNPILERYNLTQGFDAISVVDDIDFTASNPTPKKAVVQKALQDLGVAPDEVLGVEDSPSGANGFVEADVPANQVIVIPNTLTQDKVFPDGVRKLSSLLEMIPLDQFLASFG